MEAHLRGDLSRKGNWILLAAPEACDMPLDRLIARGICLCFGKARVWNLGT